MHKISLRKKLGEHEEAFIYCYNSKSLELDNKMKTMY